MEAVKIGYVSAPNIKLHERRYKYSDYAAWETDDRYELYDGVPYMMAAPNVWHQVIAGEVYHQLKGFLKGRNCRPFIAAVDVCLFSKGGDDYTVVQPDVFVVCERSKIAKKYINGAPDFIVEVLSPSTAKNDDVHKLALYLKAGVGEYWIADPETQTTAVFTLNNNEYTKRVYETPTVIPVSVLAGCEINMKSVFDSTKDID